MNDIIEEINQLKKEKDAIILAHYYVEGAIQQIADYVGDSYKLAQVAAQNPAKVIVFAGVNFMGESAKILSPNKKVLMPDLEADCPMAHMVTLDDIKRAREEYEDLAVVCYINSTAQIKTASDVCVTSSNALQIVKALPNKNIFFIPDSNLGNYVKQMVPEKNFVVHDGYCHVHHHLTKEQVEKTKAKHPNALFLAHPECRMEILELADYVGSTSGIIHYATESEANEFIIGTENGVFYELENKNPDKKFYPVEGMKFCHNMKKNSLEKVLECLREECGEVQVSDETRIKATNALERMLGLAK
ncbi:quinolinate synthase NadA [Eubacterium oxidoreducens]|uniref:Quinolinate synthase n=1 Tax=Eubacterium oxidoreducens TaxID=1732 RepID=A0A1G6AR56_EUBOX|nr:quinolinate synthase NadA [Eubacterium oxidoreducens]SDB10703.1 quinolinate synthetase [Eubacterium oxidoreducens]